MSITDSCLQGSESFLVGDPCRRQAAASSGKLLLVVLHKSHGYDLAVLLSQSYL